MTGRDVAVVLLVVLGVLVLLPALGWIGMMGGWMGPGMMGPGMMGGWGGRWGGGWGMPLLGLVFWALIVTGIVVGVVALVRRPAQGAGVTGAVPSAPAGSQTTETPLAILKRRLASGEITREEYEALKKEIASS
ncbi:MAG: SHOCT domain-containing protein [Armatimonadota bacterium]|nr:SHOCT domain-containing protein [Armatimonadota bacterium]